MLVVMIIAYLYVFEHGDGIVGKGCQREVFRKQIRCYAKLVESHQAGRERWCDFTWDTALMQSDDTLVLFTDTYEDDLRRTNAATCQILSFHFYFACRRCR